MQIPLMSASLLDGATIATGPVCTVRGLGKVPLFKTLDQISVRSPASEAGITVLELTMVIALIGILSMMVFPRVSQVMIRAQAINAAGVVANDLEYAVSLARRKRKPVRIACDCANGIYTISDRASGTVFFRRRIGGTSGGLGLTSLTLSPATVDLFPSGIGSSSLTVTVAAAGASRQVVMSSAGFVRVIR
jgi:type II secretory pathway pseudopilin PulG